MATQVDGIYTEVSIETGGLQKAAKEAEAATDKVERSLQGAASAANQAGKVMASSLDNAASSAQGLKTEITRTAQGVNDATSKMGNLGGAAQNLGWQLQDTVVQLQAGTSAFVVFAQQGSQLASAFGPSGAVFGAVIAIAGAIGGVLFSALQKTSAEIKEEFIPSVEDMAERLDTLTKSQAQIAITNINKEIEALTPISRVAAARVEYLQKQIEKYPSNASVKEWTEELQLQQGVLDGVNQKLVKQNDLLTQFQDVIKRNLNGTQGQQEAQKKQVETAAELVAQLQLATVKLNEGDAAAIRLSASMAIGLKAGEALPPEVEKAVSALIKAEAAQKALNDQKKISAQLEAEHRKEMTELQNEIQSNIATEEAQKQTVRTNFENVQKNITSDMESPKERAERELSERLAVIQEYGEQEKLHQDQIDSYKLLAAQATEKKITEIKKQEEDARRQLMQTTLGSIGDLFGNMADIAKEGGEKSFKTWKMMASAQAAINAALAITNVLATVPAPFNIPAAASVGALAAVNIAKIQGQQYGGGKLYGGPVQAGTMYPVNENGAPEIFQQGNKQYLMPNARGEVISNKNATAGGGGSITINYNPTIYAQQSDFEQIMAEQPQAVLQAVRAGLQAEGKEI